MEEFRDYKYVILDSTRVYIGSKFKVDELEEDVRIPVKFIAAVRNVIPMEEQENLTIDEHLYGLKEGETAFLMWKQLGISMKFQNLYPTKKRGKELFETKILSFGEGMERIKLDSKKQNSFLVEIQFSKIKLAMLGV